MLEILRREARIGGSVGHGVDGTGRSSRAGR
jgi:hypothetical protein